MKRKIKTLIDLLNLDECKETKIGLLLQDGLSGGEQKRVTIGIQLIMSPYVLFLDEPTTGLDSYNAFNIIKILKKLTYYGITVVASLHQPSNRILKAFDHLLILSSGFLVYNDVPNKIPDRIK